MFLLFNFVSWDQYIWGSYLTQLWLWGSFQGTVGSSQGVLIFSWDFRMKSRDYSVQASDPTCCLLQHCPLMVSETLTYFEISDNKSNSLSRETDQTLRSAWDIIRKINRLALNIWILQCSLPIIHIPLSLLISDLVLCLFY